jgi:diguanylate cyclase (GGDEF)-like protein/PAS domain S-box-containing protein
MKYVRRLALAIVLIAALGTACAGERRYYFDTHDSEQGLVQHTVGAFLQDRTGYVWIATQGGLQRFDGRSYRAYQHSNDDPDSLPDSFVTALAQDDAGMLWVGSRAHGIARFDPATGKAHSFALPAGTPDKDGRDGILGLAYDPARGLWIVDSSGIELFDPATGVRRQVYEKHFGIAGLLLSVRPVLADNGDLWLPLASGLMRIARGSDKVEPVGGEQLADARAVVLDHDIVYVVTKGAFWRLDVDRRPERLWPDADEPLKPAQILALVRDSQGKFWFSDAPRGLVVYHPVTRRAERLGPDNEVPGSLPEHSVRALMIGRQGLLWVGGVNHGFSTVDPAGARFRLLIDDQRSEQNGTNYVRALYEDERRFLWFGTDVGELKRYDPVSGKFSPHSAALRNALGAKAQDMRIGGLSRADNGKFWVGTNDGTVLYDPNTDRGVKLEIRDSDGAVLPGDWEYAPLTTRDGRLWLGSNDAGVRYGHPGRNDWQTLRHVEGRVDSLANDHIVCLTEDHAGRIWIGTAAGLSVFDPARQVTRTFRRRPGDARSLADDLVHSIYEDTAGTVWIGTHAGLSRLDDEARGDFTNFADGIDTTTTVYAILEDAHHDLWISTDRGIQRFDRAQATLEHFALNDGQQGMEFNTGAALRLADGELAFGGTNGANLFRPENVRPSTFVPPVVITDVQIGNAPQIAPPSSAVLRVPQAERIVSFDYVALDYAAPLRNRYEFKLEGFDRDWIDIEEHHSTTYTNLSPGNYVFRVRASNHDGVWSKDATVALPLTIEPAWWNSFPARLAWGAMALAAVAWIWHTQRRKLAVERQHRAELASSEEHFRMAIWGSGDDFWDVVLPSRTVRQIRIDDQFNRRDVLVSEEDFWHKVVHPDDLSMYHARREAHLQGEAPTFECEYRARRPDGNWGWRHVRGKVVERDSEGRPLRICGMGRMLTPEYELMRLQRIAAEVLNSMTEGVCVVDLSWRVVSANRACCNMIGYDEAEIVGKSAAILLAKRMPEEAYRRQGREVVEQGSWRGEMWQRRKNGEEFLSWFEINTVRDAAGTPSHYVAVFSDITDRKRSEQELRYLADYDMLTGLSNRAHFIERLNYALGRSQGDGARIAVLFLDLDHFKDINDSVGHIAGDQILCGVAQRLRDCVRGNDVIARLGGDEFTLMIENLAGPEQAEALARRIIGILSMPLSIEGGREFVITPSIGISLSPDHASNPTDLLKFADMAMYQSKERGRNTFMWYAPEMDLLTHRRAEMTAALRHAIENYEFSLVYQPKLSLHDHRICGVEALLRWHNAKLGDVPPTDFIPLAEQTGLIAGLGEFVLETACAQLSEWRALGIDGIEMAINVSVLDLLREDLLHRIKQTLRRYAIPPERLQLELTETTLMAHAEQTLGMLDQIKAMGIGLAIDDFGTGYSSLSHLKRLPIDTLKIDQNFVRDISTDLDDRAITATIVRMAQMLGLTVVAEGVETIEQYTYLRVQGCDEIQGFWFSPPLAAAQCTTFLQDAQAALNRVLI